MLFQRICSLLFGGVRVDSASTHGVEVTSAFTTGVFVGSAGNYGVTVGLSNGHLTGTYKTVNDVYVWPVRSGQ